MRFYTRLTTYCNLLIVIERVKHLRPNTLNLFLNTYLKIAKLFVKFRERIQLRIPRLFKNNEQIKLSRISPKQPLID